MIQSNDRVFCPEQPEYGYGVVRLVEEDMLSEEPICQVAFEWVPGLTELPSSALRVLSKLDCGISIKSTEWGGMEELRCRVSAALILAENSQTAAFIRSFTMPLPHQAYLLEKILGGRRFGHVIADDVGMGKTIEAGLIIASLRQRKPLSRVLVLCPAGVVLQWQDEMDEHFGLAFSIAGRDFSADKKVNWDSQSLVLASLDTLKQERLRDVLKSAPQFDLVVCDEAHRLTARREFLKQELYRTQNYLFVEWLTQQGMVQWEENGDGSPRSPKLLLMSATPHQGDDLRFRYLLQLARPDLMDAESREHDGNVKAELLEECLTRTAKKRAVDWQGKAVFLGHETRTLEVRLTPQEKEVQIRLSRYIQSEMELEQSGSEALVRALVMNTFQKIAASSWAALKAALETRLERATGRANSPDRAVDGYESFLENEYPFLGGATEIDALREVLSAIGTVRNDSKWETFQDLIQPGNGFREAGERILIFTQYRKTQEWLAERLKQTKEAVFQIHGGMSVDERKRNRGDFESKGTILISTEAGSEGANLHRKCHLMVNYDLPWNPMRLLQRIGRLDRYGQKKPVRVANLKTPESWDAMVAMKIEAKLASVQSSMGLIADEDYKTMVMGSIYDAIDVAKVMKECDWGANWTPLESILDEKVTEILQRKSSLDSLFQESLGMPQNYGKGSPALTADDFRLAFSWAAAKHEIVLKETRTSDRKFLRGVYHFTLPPAFRGGLRPTRDCYLVFEREVFAEVRGTSLGRVRGQEITPSLAGLGDAVTDWFFKSSLQATASNTVYCLKRPEKIKENEQWLIVYAARWKGKAGWTGPDKVVACSASADGSLSRLLDARLLIQLLQVLEMNYAQETEMVLPDFSSCLKCCKEELRQIVDTSMSKSVYLSPIAIIQWVG